MKELIVKNLHARVEGKEILKGVNLVFKEGETIALLGPNGHGKSTLLSVLMGDPGYEVTSGSVTIDGEDLLKMTPDERSKKGLFLALQNPPAIPGLNSSDFYRAALNAHREKALPLFSFYRELENAYKEVSMDFAFANRNLNEGFSGGERKRNEILQMLLLSPTFAMLDEIDSGLDVDAIKIVSDVIVKQKKKGSGFLIVSHYARLYDLVGPDRSLVMVDGKIAFEGKKEVIERIDKEGYEWLTREHGIEIKKHEEEKKMNEVSIGVCATKEVTRNK